MADDDSEIFEPEVAPPIETIFEKELSSEEPPMEEWSSMEFDVREVENIKRTKQELGLYDPGSGEICTKYEPLSASSVFRHVYYNYPGVLDPGIQEALFNPIPKIIYPDDGQELYLDLCKEMDLCPIRRFCAELLQDIVDLRYYGISLRGFRPIAMALKLNRNVKVLNLTDNWISADGAFHLGEMLVENVTLEELNLTGCRLGANGARLLFDRFHLNRSVKKLNLSKNQLGDEGFEYLTRSIYKGSDVADINVSYNKLTGKSAASLSDVLEINNKLTHLDISWNTMLSPNAIYTLCGRLSQNTKFQELNLSWNSLSGLRVGQAIRTLLKNPSLRRLNLANNMFKGLTVKFIGTNLPKAKNLEVLDMSNNPLAPEDATKLVAYMKERSVKLQKLLLGNVTVDDEFMEIREEALSLKFRKNAVITYGVHRPKFVSKGFDMREILLNRADTLCKGKKKQPVDIVLLFREIHKTSQEPWDTKEFNKALRKAGVQLDEDVLNELFNIFAGPKGEKNTTINVCRLIDYLNRKWPDRQLPPTPPPEVEPEPVIKKKAKKGKKK